MLREVAHAHNPCFSTLHRRGLTIQNFCCMTWAHSPYFLFLHGWGPYSQYLYKIGLCVRNAQVHVIWEVVWDHWATNPQNLSTLLQVQAFIGQIMEMGSLGNKKPKPTPLQDKTLSEDDQKLKIQPIFTQNIYIPNGEPSKRKDSKLSKRGESPFFS